MIGLARFFPALAALAGLLAAGYAGHEYAAAQGRASLAQCEQTRADMQVRAARLAQIRLDAAARAADAALTDAVRRRDAAETRAREVRREIYRLAVGRPCLSGELAGVLNRAPGIAAADLPAAAGQPVAAAAAAAEAGAVDDAGVAEWVAESARLYEICRGRIDALRTWSEGVRHEQEDQ